MCVCLRVYRPSTLISPCKSSRWQKYRWTCVVDPRRYVHSHGETCPGRSSAGPNTRAPSVSCVGCAGLAEYNPGQSGRPGSITELHIYRVTCATCTVKICRCTYGGTFLAWVCMFSVRCHIWHQLCCKHVHSVDWLGMLCVNCT